MEEDCSLESLKAKSNEELMRLAQKNVKGTYDIIYERLFGKFVNVACKILRNRTDAEDAAEEALIKGYVKRRKFLLLSKVETWLYRILINVCLDEPERHTKELSEYLGKLPPEINFSAYHLRKKIRYNEKSQRLVLKGFLSPEEKNELLALSNDANYQEVVEELYLKQQDQERKEDADLRRNKGETLFEPDIEKIVDKDSQFDKKTRFQLMLLEECKKMLLEEEKTILELREFHNFPFKEIAKITEAKYGHSSLGNIKNKVDSAKKKLKDCIEKRLLPFKETFEK